MNINSALGFRDFHNKKNTYGCKMQLLYLFSFIFEAVVVIVTVVMIMLTTMKRNNQISWFK